MAIKQLTLNQTVKLIKDIASSHYQINSIYFGDVWEFLAQTDNVYPAMFFSLTGSSISQKRLSMNFSFFFLDRQLQDETNENDVLSDQLLIAQDIISMFNYPKFNWEIDDNINVEYFTENEKDYLAGVKVDLTISFPMVNDRCQIPTDFEYPDYSEISGGTSGGGFSTFKLLYDYPTLADFPEIGIIGKIYIANDTNAIYRFVDNQYVEFSNTQLVLKEDKANKGIPNGYASLDANGKITSTQIATTWMDLVRGYSSIPTKLFDVTGGTIWQYKYNNDLITLYRQILNGGLEDEFYSTISGETVSNLIAKKQIIY